MTDFNKAAQPAPKTLTSEEAYDAVCIGYGAVRAALPEMRAATALQLVKSPAFHKMVAERPWFTVDIVYAAFENIPPQERRTFVRGILDDQELPRISSDFSYPQAISWYAQEMDRLQEGGEQDPNRKAWQHGWRSTRAGFDQMKAEGISQVTCDVIKSLQLTVLAQSPLLAEMSVKTPWSALDIVAVLAEVHPEAGRRAFAEKYVFGGVAYQSVARDCPQMAQFFADKVNKLAPPNQQLAVDPNSPNLV
ncbi:MAG: hypothetical protein AAB276_09210 [Pseudomonadota bacterium]